MNSKSEDVSIDHFSKDNLAKKKVLWELKI